MIKAHELIGAGRTTSSTTPPSKGSTVCAPARQAKEQNTAMMIGSQAVAIAQRAPQGAAVRQARLGTPVKVAVRPQNVPSRKQCRVGTVCQAVSSPPLQLNIGAPFLMLLPLGRRRRPARSPERSSDIIPQSMQQLRPFKAVSS